MSETITYKGVTASIRFDPRDQILIGRVLGTQEIIGFHAEDGKGIVRAFEEIVDSGVADNARKKEWSGRVMFRVAPEVHEAATMAAQAEHMSLNQWGEKALREAADKSLSRPHRA